MSRPIIRKGTVEDLPGVYDLILELAEYEKAADQVETSVEEMERDAFGENPVFDFFVAEVDEEIAGVALYYIKYSTWKGRGLYLEDFVVRQQHRGKGIGALLFEQLLKLAKEKGYRRMEWLVLNWNEPALNFYRKYGADLDPEWINGQFNYEQLQAFNLENN
ncbi:GNAT family N-acetyltransferase [Halocola ammonii]